MLRNQRGFTYLIALFMVAILSIVTLRALENSLTRERRAKEEQLLFVGQAYQKAITTYYLNSPGRGSYPQNLADMLDEGRTSATQKSLRRLYFDPITGSQDWGLIPAETTNGGIMGVYSKSSQQPIKVNGFPSALSNFIGATSYQQWQFVYQPVPANRNN